LFHRYREWAAAALGAILPILIISALHGESGEDWLVRPLRW
jgi:hypothetical protein